MRLLQTLSGLALCSFVATTTSYGEKVFEPIETIISEARQAIESFEAVPAKKSHRVLIFGRSGGPHREVIPTGRIVMQMLGEMTGAYESDLAEDPKVFEAENLKQYDAIVFCNTTGSVLRKTIEYKDFMQLPEAERKAESAAEDILVNNLLDFIRNGGGFFGIHAATDSLRGHKEYLNMIGGEFNKHPWNGNHQVTIRIEDPEHALVKDIWDDSKFRFCDEIYQFQGVYSRERQRVLMSLVVAESDEPYLPLARDDGDFPVSWIRHYGEGAVYYCSLGHRKETYAEPEVLEFWLRGMQFVLGDLDADTTPVPQPE